MLETKNVKKLSVVIAAYNEEPRIENVLKIVVGHSLIDEVIVVDDCSHDKTSEVAARFNVKVLRNEKNLGKTLSVKKGVEVAKNDIIALLDADLRGITREEITMLANPVIEGKVDWTLSLRSNSWPWMKWVKMDWVSGERVIKKELLNDPLIWSRPEVGFGLETLMNKSLLGRQTKFCSVYLPTLTTERKSEKMGFFKGWYSDFKMVYLIMTVLPLYKVAGQFVQMAYLSNKYRKTLNV